MTTILCRVIIKDVSGSRNSWSCLCSLVWTDGPVWFQVSHPNLVWFGYCVLKFSVQWTWAKPIFRRVWGFIRLLFPWLLQICIRISAPHQCLEALCVGFFWFGWVGASPVSTVWWILPSGGFSKWAWNPTITREAKEWFQQLCMMWGSMFPLEEEDQEFVISCKRWFHKSLDWWIPEKNKICESFQGAFSVF